MRKGGDMFTRGIEKEHGIEKTSEEYKDDLSVKIYAAAHQPCQLPPQADGDIYKILQVGAAGKAYFSDSRDNLGENISELNHLYNELTGLYWIWKNCEEDVLGLCHYRRFFVNGWGKMVNLLMKRNEGYIGKNYICNTLNRYGAIVHNLSMALPSVERQYCKHNSPKCFFCLKEAIVEMHPDYMDAFERVMNGSKIHFLNMIIAKRELISKYAEWLFDLLFETEKKITCRFGSVPDREMGMLGERLMDVWLLKNNIAVKSCFSINIERIDWKIW